jgi:S-adenosylmethionine hydrolase
LSLALGRQNVVHVALIDPAAASRVRHAIDRWRAFIGPDEGLNARPAGAPGASALSGYEG